MKNLHRKVQSYGGAHFYRIIYVYRSEVSLFSTIKQRYVKTAPVWSFEALSLVTGLFVLAGFRYIAYHVSL